MEATETRLKLSDFESHALSRYQSTTSLCEAMVRRFEDDIELLQAEIQQEEARLQFLRERLDGMNQDLIRTRQYAEDAGNQLLSAKTRILEGREIPSDEEHLYELESTPNGTVKALIRRA